MQAHADTLVPAGWKLGWGAAQSTLPLGSGGAWTKGGSWALYRRGGEEVAAMAAAELPGRTFAHLVLPLDTTHNQEFPIC
eukprot:1161749-Pelagomonas_calceolata.AAC.1